MILRHELTCVFLAMIVKKMGEIHRNSLLSEDEKCKAYSSIGSRKISESV